MNRQALNCVILVFCLCVSGFAQTYTTNFPLTENPISEGGRWINGGAVGIDFQDVQTANGRAFSSSVVHGYDDCNACLTGFPPDQSAQATIYRDPSYTPPSTHEVQLHLRTTTTANSLRTYEINFWFPGTTLQIARWNGQIGDYAMLNYTGPGPNGLATGDVIKAQIVGSTITVYKNGSLIATCIDNGLTTGNPGMGFFVRPGGTLDKFCITSYTAEAIGGAPQTGLSVTPATSSVEELLTRQFTATAAYSGGSTSNVSSTAAWTSTNTAVATVSSTGLATGRTVGTTKIIAVYGGFRDTSDLTVTATTATLDSLVITGSTGFVVRGGTATLGALGYYSNGTTQDKTSSAAWSSNSNPTATVSSGVVSGVALGNVVITASLTGKQDTVRLSVIDPPAFSKKINFQTITAAVPSGYVADSGLAYSSARGFGWAAAQAETRERNVNPDKRYDTFIKTYSAVNWMLDLPSPGQYIITAAMGEPSYSTTDTLKFGTQTLIAAYNDPDEYTTLKDTLTVAGSQLVLSVMGAFCYIDVESYTGGTEIDLSAGAAAAQPAFLKGNPNPFHQATALEYGVAGESRVRIGIYDQSGRMIRLLKDGLAQPGRHSVNWDGRDQAGMRLSSGVYLARILTGNKVYSQRLLLAK